ncbi:DNA adenine methylase [Gordonia soli]|uniref:Putative methyltransferase n=1 Tax=Gordonia soli NBRC 108243 TaxID=1223545 RepID=M0QRG8_9ACTN|nr:DNA adenine methylase [Gordonia soli]GAC71069.1 putative methyltransferase [Gordonia soli NBRC 108243]
MSNRSRVHSPYCFAKPLSRLETVNDLDGDIMTFWRVLRDRPDELIRACALTPHSRTEHEHAHAVAQLEHDEVERARLVWVRITQGRAGLLRKTGWRHYIDPAGTKTAMPGYLDGYVERMAVAAERLHNVSLECRPALDVIRSYDRGPRVCMYIDPPYLSTTRASGAYQTEMGRVDQHLELLDALIDCESSIILSGYASELYDDMLAGWDRFDIPTTTGQGGRRSERTEVVWCNRVGDLTLDFGSAV